VAGHLLLRVSDHAEAVEREFLGRLRECVRVQAVAREVAAMKKRFTIGERDLLVDFLERGRAHEMNPARCDLWTNIIDKVRKFSEREKNPARRGAPRGLAQTNETTNLIP
jgi:hypothetical protein